MPFRSLAASSMASRTSGHSANRDGTLPKQFWQVPKPFRSLVQRRMIKIIAGKLAAAAASDNRIVTSISSTRCDIAVPHLAIQAYAAMVDAENTKRRNSDDSLTLVPAVLFRAAGWWARQFPTQLCRDTPARSWRWPLRAAINGAGRNLQALRNISVGMLVLLALLAAAFALATGGG